MVEVWGAKEEYWEMDCCVMILVMGFVVCFTVLLPQCEICVENTCFKCKCQASDKVTSIHQIKFTHSFFLFLFQIKQEALEEERKKKEKEEEEAKAQVCNQGLIIKSSFWNRGIDIVFLCINSVKNVD